MGLRLNALVVRLMGTELLTVRIDLACHKRDGCSEGME